MLIKYSGPVVFSRSEENKSGLKGRLTGTIVLSVQDIETQRDLIDVVIVTRRSFGDVDTDCVLMFDSSSNAYFVKTMEDGYPKDHVYIGKIRKMDDAMAFFPAIEVAKILVDETAEIPAYVKEGHFITASKGEPVQPWQAWHCEPVFYFELINVSIRAGRGDGEYIGFESLLTAWLQRQGHIDRLIEVYR